MAEKVRLEGFQELDRALGQLKGSTERGVLRRIAKRALEPMLAAAQQTVPVDEGDLRDSLRIASGPLTKGAKAQERSFLTRGVKLFLGTASRNAVRVEYGTANMSAQPYLRPAWDSGKDRALEIVKRDLGEEIRRTAERANRRAAKLARR